MTALKTAWWLRLWVRLRAELQSLGHKPNFFYLQHAMGLGSSTGLGLALCLPQQKVVVFDGDGSILMNLGGLYHAGALSAKNMVMWFSTMKVCSPSADFPRQLPPAAILKVSLALPALRDQDCTHHGRISRHIF